MNLVANKMFKRILSLLVILTVGICFYMSLTSHWQVIHKVSIKFDFSSVLAILLFSAATMVSAKLWGMILNNLTFSEGKQLTSNSMYMVHISSWLLKYVPGQIGALLNKVIWGQQHGYPKNLIIVSYIYENVFLIATSLVTTIPILLFFLDKDIFLHNLGYFLFPLMTLIPAGLVIYQKSMCWIMNSACQFFLRYKFRLTYSLATWDSFKFLVLYLIPRVMNAMGFVMIVQAFYPIAFNAYVPLAVIYIFAGAIGVLAIFVPSGIGVREAVIVLLSAHWMPVEIAIIVAVIARLYSTIADGLLALFYVFLKIKASYSTL